MKKRRYYLTVTYKNTETLEIEERVFVYRFKWMAKPRIWWIGMYQSDVFPSFIIPYYRLETKDIEI